MNDTRIHIHSNIAEHKAVIGGKSVNFTHSSYNEPAEVLQVRPNLKFIGKASTFITKLAKTYYQNETNLFAIKAEGE